MHKWTANVNTTISSENESETSMHHVNHTSQNQFRIVSDLLFFLLYYICNCLVCFQMILVIETVYIEVDQITSTEVYIKWDTFEADADIDEFRVRW